MSKILDNPEKYFDNLSTQEFKSLLDEFGFEYKDNNKLEKYEYKCLYCGIKRSFINSLRFDKWIVNHKCDVKDESLEDELKRIDEFFDNMSTKELEDMLLRNGIMEEKYIVDSDIEFSYRKGK